MHLQRKALLLSYFTVSYNLLEGLAAVITGLFTGSIALLGFGVDSFIESLSGSIMIWRFRQHEKLSEEEEERIEKKALKLVAYTFFVLAAYVGYEAIKKLYLREVPEASLFGIIIAILSLFIMPTLTYLKYKTGKDLKSSSLVADSKQTLVCVLMSITLLIGLALNYFIGLWWADPVAGLIFVGVLIREGLEALEGEDDGS